MRLAWILAICSQQVSQGSSDEELRKVRPAEVRVTVDLRATNPGEAAIRILAPFGLDPSSILPHVRTGMFDLKLNNAPFWEALDSFCERAGAQRITHPWHPAVMVGWICGTGMNEMRFSHVDAGCARIGVAAHPEGHGGLSRGWLEVLPMLPPGSRPGAMWLEDVVMKDSSGTAVPVKDSCDSLGMRSSSQVPFGIHWIRRHPGKITWGRGCHIVPVLEGAKGPWTLEASLVVSYPRRVEIKRKPMNEDLSGQTFDFDDTSIKVKHVRHQQDSPGWDIGFAWEPADAPDMYVAWQEDDKGIWLADIVDFTRREEPDWVECSNTGRAQTGTVLCLARYVGKEETRLPFMLGAIEIPSRDVGEEHPGDPIWLVGVGGTLLVLLSVALQWRRSRRRRTASVELR